MTQLLPVAHSAQPAGTAMRLAVKDELRSLRFNLAQGAHWLHDLGGVLAEKSGIAPPPEAIASLDKIQHLIDSTAQQALSGLLLVKQTAAAPLRAQAKSAVAPQGPGTFHAVSTLGAHLAVELLSPSACFADDGARLLSRQFTEMFYRLIRNVLEARGNGDMPRSPLIVRQQAVDEAYWLVIDRQPALVARVRGAGQDADNPVHTGDRALLCAAIFQALIDTQPLRDPGLPPWAARALPVDDQRTARLCLLTAVLACGLAQDNTGMARPATDGLRLGTQLANARIANIELALGKPRPAEALAAEMAFIFRHV